MLHYIQQDVTKVKHGIVAHGCNILGVMGAGVALAIRNKWPSAFLAYKTFCDTHKNSKDLLGLVLYVRVEHNEREVKWEDITGVGLQEVTIANIFTQQSYGRSGRVYANLEAIATGLDNVFREGLRRNLPIYMSKIGCNLGGLKWETQVGPIVEALAKAYSNVTIYVCDI